MTNVWRDNVSNEIQLFYYYSPLGDKRGKLMNNGNDETVYIL